MIVVAAFYKFVRLDDFEDLKAVILGVLLKNGVKGTVLLAREGINSTIAGSREGIDAVLGFLRSDSRLADLVHKESFCDEMPFFRAKVKLKKEIVTIGVAEVDPTHVVGTYVDPEDWNELIRDPEVLVLDTRNQYEVEIGSFKGAVDPETDSFRQFPEFVREKVDKSKFKKVAMFCTGGIRCEKASSFMLHEGFDEVYHLKGGILKYLEEVKPEDSLWEGECFVFDQRVTVDQHLDEGSFDQCHACRRPISDEDMACDEYVEGVSCPHCFGDLSEKSLARAGERQKQCLLARERGERHLGGF